MFQKASNIRKELAGIIITCLLTLFVAGISFAAEAPSPAQEDEVKTLLNEPYWMYKLSGDRRKLFDKIVSSTATYIPVIKKVIFESASQARNKDAESAITLLGKMGEVAREDMIDVAGKLTVELRAMVTDSGEKKTPRR